MKRKLGGAIVSAIGTIGCAIVGIQYLFDQRLFRGGLFVGMAVLHAVMFGLWIYAAKYDDV